MKKILLLFLLGCLLVACGGSVQDNFTGKWVDENWQRDSKSLEITKKGRNKYIVKSSFPDKEEIAVIDKKNENVLIVGEGFFQSTLKFDYGREELQGIARNYIKVDEQLQKEIDNYIKGLINEILGKWKKEVTEFNVFSYSENKKPIEIYSYEITPNKEKNKVNIKVELLITKNNKRIISEGIFEVLTDGQLHHIKTIGKNTNFFPNTFLMNINSIKNFKKVN